MIKYGPSGVCSVRFFPDSSTAEEQTPAFSPQYASNKLGSKIKTKVFIPVANDHTMARKVCCHRGSHPPNSAAGDGVSDVVIPSDNVLSLKHNEVFRLLYA